MGILTPSNISWLVFSVVVVTIMVLDLGVFSKKKVTPSFQKSLLLSSLYVLIATMFGIFLYFEVGETSAIHFFTAYSLEMSLSFDNIFVISLIFAALSIPERYQHRVLFWGILGAMVMRGIFIFAGAAIVSSFHWVLLVFAAFLIYSGVKILFAGGEEEVDIEKNRTLKTLRKYIRITPNLVDSKFFHRDEHRKLMATPLFVALVMVEVTDLIFAVDSIPATFSVTTDPLVIYTSNIFAIVGLRSMFFVLRDLIDRFIFLPKALSIVLVYIGVKVYLSELNIVHIDPFVSLGMVLGCLSLAIVLSLLKTKSERSHKV